MLLLKSSLSLHFLHAVAKADLTADDAPPANSNYWKEFVDYAAEYNKPYLSQNKDDELVQKRFTAFQINMDRIETHNAQYLEGIHTFELGLNDIADLNDDEYKQLLGYKHKPSEINLRSDATCALEEAFGDLPEEWDWRSHDVVNPIKNQKQCGSCWAFSAVASMESVYARKTGKLVSFSEQELVDCTLDGIDTCTHGGEMHDGFEEVIKNHGGKIDPENVYEYTAVSKGVCSAKDSLAVGHFTSYVNVTSGCEAELKSAVATEAVIAVAIDASSFTFQLYRHGVYNWPACGSKIDELDHGVAVVGYGVYKGKEFWLVRNSWGTTWGRDGYIMMSRNLKNQCGIATDPSYPVMDGKTKVPRASVYIPLL